MKNVTGRIGEEYAKSFLEDLGYKIVETNYHSRFGEIDIICTDDRFIAFVEVKTRAKGSLTTPLEAVDSKKQQKIILTAQDYLQKNYTYLQPRFDVISIYTENQNVVSCKHIENAFST